MTPFFITGFPRSRTAWTATYLTQGNIHCFHDGLVECDEVKGLRSLFESAGKPFVGNSDPANALFHPFLMEAFPDANWFVIWREPKEVLKSLERLQWGCPEKIVKAWTRALEHIQGYGAFKVDFKDLSETAGILAERIDPDWEFNPLRDALFKKMNIQMDGELLDRQRIELAPKIERWLAKGKEQLPWLL